jgi:hypothetical protein
MLKLLLFISKSILIAIKNVGNKINIKLFEFFVILYKQNKNYNNPDKIITII